MNKWLIAGMATLTLGVAHVSVHSTPHVSVRSTPRVTRTFRAPSRASSLTPKSSFKAPSKTTPKTTNKTPKTTVKEPKTDTRTHFQQTTPQTTHSSFPWWLFWLNHNDKKDNKDVKKDQPKKEQKKRGISTALMILFATIIGGVLGMLLMTFLYN